MGGKVYLPESMGGGAATFPDGAIVLEPDGAVIAQSNNVDLSFSFGSWSITSSQVTVDRSGMSFHGNLIRPLGLPLIGLPDFTVYSTGELAVGGQSTDSGTIPLPGGQVSINYSGVRFDDTGVHLWASVTMPATWGVASLNFDDILITPEGHVSAATSVRNVVLPLDALGLVASFDTVRLSPEGFRFDGAAFRVQGGPLAGQSLTIEAALLDYSGNLDLYGFAFAPLDLYGYKVNLDSLSVGPTGFGFTGGIRLADNLPIPELQGAYLALSKFRLGFDGQIQEFKVTLDQGFHFTVYDSWNVGIQGLSLDKNILTVNLATLDLPASFNLGQLTVSGMTLDLQSGAITWGEIAVSGAQYSWNGLNFVLTKLTISPDRGLIFKGSVTVPVASSDGTPYPEILQNRTFLFNTLQILPSGLPGIIDASVDNLNGFLLGQNILVKNGTASFSNTAGNIIFGFTGAVTLGTGFMAGLAGVELKINDLRINAVDGTFAGLDVAVTQGLPAVSLPGGLQYQASTLGLKKTGDRSFNVETSGNFLLGASFPGVLKNKSIVVTTFVINSDGVLQTLAATLDLPGDQTLTNGLLLSDATVSVSTAADSSLKYALTGKVKLGSGFLDGLAGLTLDITTLEWDGTGSLMAIDVATSWTGSRSFFGGSTIENGSVAIAGTSPQAWTVGMTGVFKLPATGLPEGLAGQGGKTVSIQDFSFTTTGQVLKMKGTLGLDQVIPLFAGVNMVGASLGFSMEGVSLPKTMMEGLPDSIALARVLVGWDGTLKDLAAGVGHANVKIGGFTTDITNLVVSIRGVAIEQAVLTLPPNLGNRQILVLNAGYNTNGQFTGTIGVDEIDQDIAGFGLALRTLTLEVGAKVLRIQTAMIRTPHIGSLNANLQLNGVVISPSGWSWVGSGSETSMFRSTSAAAPSRFQGAARERYPAWASSTRSLPSPTSPMSTPSGSSGRTSSTLSALEFRWELSHPCHFGLQCNSSFTQGGPLG